MHRHASPARSARCLLPLIAAAAAVAPAAAAASSKLDNAKVATFGKIACQTAAPQASPSAGSLSRVTPEVQASSRSSEDEKRRGDI